METKYCTSCGAASDGSASFCPKCGASFQQQQCQQQYNQHYQQSHYQSHGQQGIDPNWPIKSKTTAGLLGILIGGLGIHKFYLGETGLGIIYLLFCWTGIPSIIGLIEGIIYLTQSDYEFQVKNKVRIY
ncbi:MAG: NINE protein [Clostridiales bacterium]|nr:NINE protein [Clostridiales bacterium]